MTRPSCTESREHHKLSIEPTFHTRCSAVLTTFPVSSHHNRLSKNHSFGSVTPVIYEYTFYTYVYTYKDTLEEEILIYSNIHKPCRYALVRSSNSSSNIGSWTLIPCMKTPSLLNNN